MAATPGDVFLVRHGETEWSLTGRHTGLTDLPLTAHGQTQALSVGVRLRGLQFDHVFSSPLRRALHTCVLAGFDGQGILDPDLAEWNYGDYEGRTLAQIHRERPGWELFRDGCPGGESVADVVARVDRVIARVRSLQGHVILFSSGHLLRSFAARWLETSVQLGRQLVLDPAALCVLGYDHGGSERVIRRWNAGALESA
jgi:broad specificity phosphatase PhoE